MLWIAFKNYYLRDEEQRATLMLHILACCELLSKIIIFVTRNNKTTKKACIKPVVNCFQKLLSSWRGTTSVFLWLYLHKLWIAFKNYYLRDEEQPCDCWPTLRNCCELLSKIIIFVTRNNTSDQTLRLNLVVNCFQKLLSSWRGTTFTDPNAFVVMLWIAFKNYYLRDEEQLWRRIWNHRNGCELLSKIIIFVTRNNGWANQISGWGVVNCFQKLLSSWRGTTQVAENQKKTLLWIAFKNYYLRDEEQHTEIWKHEEIGCELLSKIIIFVTRNNGTSQRNARRTVVNCFQKLLSSWRGTT